MGKYLKVMIYKVTTLIHKRLKGIKVYVDVHFEGNWNKEESYQ